MAIRALLGIVVLLPGLVIGVCTADEGQWSRAWEKLPAYLKEGQRSLQGAADKATNAFLQASKKAYQKSYEIQLERYQRDFFKTMYRSLETMAVAAQAAWTYNYKSKISNDKTAIDLFVDGQNVYARNYNQKLWDKSNLTVPQKDQLNRHLYLKGADQFWRNIDRMLKKNGGKGVPHFLTPQFFNSYGRLTEKERGLTRALDQKIKEWAYGWLQRNPSFEKFLADRRVDYRNPSSFSSEDKVERYLHEVVFYYAAKRQWANDLSARPYPEIKKTYKRWLSQVAKRYFVVTNLIEEGVYHVAKDKVKVLWICNQDISQKRRQVFHRGTLKERLGSWSSEKSFKAHHFYVFDLIEPDEIVNENEAGDVEIFPGRDYNNNDIDFFSRQFIRCTVVDDRYIKAFIIDNYLTPHQRSLLVAQAQKNMLNRISELPKDDYTLFLGEELVENDRQKALELMQDEIAREEYQKLKKKWLYQNYDEGLRRYFWNLIFKNMSLVKNTVVLPLLADNIVEMENKFKREFLEKFYQNNYFSDPSTYKDKEAQLKELSNYWEDQRITSDELLSIMQGEKRRKKKFDDYLATTNPMEEILRPFAEKMREKDVNAKGRWPSEEHYYQAYLNEFVYKYEPKVKQYNWVRFHADAQVDRLFQDDIIETMMFTPRNLNPELGFVFDDPARKTPQEIRDDLANEVYKTGGEQLVTRPKEAGENFLVDQYFWFNGDPEGRQRAHLEAKAIVAPTSIEAMEVSFQVRPLQEYRLNSSERYQRVLADYKRVLTQTFEWEEGKLYPDYFSELRVPTYVRDLVLKTFLADEYYQKDQGMKKLWKARYLDSENLSDSDQSKLDIWLEGHIKSGRLNEQDIGDVKKIAAIKVGRPLNRSKIEARQGHMRFNEAKAKDVAMDIVNYYRFVLIEMYIDQYKQEELIPHFKRMHEHVFPALLRFVREQMGAGSWNDFLKREEVQKRDIRQMVKDIYQPAKSMVNLVSMYARLLIEGKAKAEIEELEVIKPLLKSPLYKQFFSDTDEGPTAKDLAYLPLYLEIFQFAMEEKVQYSLHILFETWLEDEVKVVKRAFEKIQNERGEVEDSPMWLLDGGQKFLRDSSESYRQMLEGLAQKYPADVKLVHYRSISLYDLDNQKKSEIYAQFVDGDNYFDETNNNFRQSFPYVNLDQNSRPIIQGMVVFRQNKETLKMVEGNEEVLQLAMGRQYNKKLRQFKVQAASVLAEYVSYTALGPGDQVIGPRKRSPDTVLSWMLKGIPLLEKERENFKANMSLWEKYAPKKPLMSWRNYGLNPTLPDDWSEQNSLSAPSGSDSQGRKQKRSNWKFQFGGSE